MATTTTITKMLLRRGNDSDRKNTILASGEPGFTLDTKRLWIGDGQTPGGYPALSAAEEFFTYDDGVNPCVLRVNIGAYESMGSNTQSLSQILASTASGPDSQESYFHPTDRDIKTSHDINLVGTSRAGGKAYMTSSSDLHIRAANTSSSQLILGASSGQLQSGTDTPPYIQVENDGQGGAVRIKCKNFQVTSDTTSWADAEHTLFEDPTIDINVQKSIGGQISAPGNTGQSSHSTGIHFAHNNFLSAGNIKIGEGGNAGEDSICLTPPEYKNAWASDINNVRDVPGKSTATGAFQFGDKTYSYDFNGTIYSPNNGNMGFSPTKPIVFKSVRPHQYSGNAHVVLESGLIVYGNDAGNDLNAYRINQSLDTRADATFKSVTIVDENGAPSSIDVSSGGTGSTSFTKNGVITTLGNSDASGPLVSTTLNAGEFLGGSTGGVKKVTLTASTNSGLQINTTASTGNMTIENTFMPSYVDLSNVDDHFQKYKFVSADNGTHNTWQTDRGNGELALRGDANWTTSTLIEQGNKATVIFGHGYLGDWTSFTEAGAHSDPLKRIIGQKAGATGVSSGISIPGRVISSLTVDTRGHVTDAEVTDHDTRYAMLSPTGGVDIANVTPATEPNSVNMSSTYNVNAAGAVTGTHDGHVIQSVTLSAYGTVGDYVKKDLTTMFATIKGVDTKIAAAVNSIPTSDQYLQLSADTGTQNFSSSSSAIINFSNRPLQFQHGTSMKYVLDTTSAGLKVKKISGNGKFSIGDSYATVDADEFSGASNPTVIGGLRLKRHATGATYTELRYTGGTKNIWYSHGGSSEFLSDQIVINTSAVNTFMPVTFTEFEATHTARHGTGRLAHRIRKDNGTEFAYNPSTGRLKAGSYEGDISATTGINDNTQTELNGLQTAINNVSSSITLPTDFVSKANGGTFGGSVSIDGHFGLRDSLGNAVVCTGTLQNGAGNFTIRTGAVGATSGNYTNLLILEKGTGDLDVMGDVVAFSSFSDKNLKKDITTLDGTDSLNKVLQLRGVSFKWKDKSLHDKGQQIGLIAQDVEKVVPEVIDEKTRIDDDDTLYKRVDYDKLVPLLIESIKELSAKVEKLESQLK